MNGGANKRKRSETETPNQKLVRRPSVRTIENPPLNNSALIHGADAAMLMLALVSYTGNAVVLGLIRRRTH